MLNQAFIMRPPLPFLHPTHEQLQMLHFQVYIFLHLQMYHCWVLQVLLEAQPIKVSATIELRIMVGAVISQKLLFIAQLLLQLSESKSKAISPGNGDFKPIFQQDIPIYQQIRMQDLQAL